MADKINSDSKGDAEHTRPERIIQRGVTIREIRENDGAGKILVFSGKVRQL